MAWLYVIKIYRQFADLFMAIEVMLMLTFLIFACLCCFLFICFFGVINVLIKRVFSIINQYNLCTFTSVLLSLIVDAYLTAILHNPNIA